MTKRERAVPRFLLTLAHHYAMKAQAVRGRKGQASMHTRRLERIAKHLRAAYDGIIGERSES